MPTDRYQREVRHLRIFLILSAVVVIPLSLLPGGDQEPSYFFPFVVAPLGIAVAYFVGVAFIKLNSFLRKNPKE